MAKKAEKKPKKDMFTLLLKKELGVDAVAEHRFCERKWRFDYAIPEAKIAIEIEGGVWIGGRHVRPRGFLNDMEKYNRAAVLGWRVIRVTPIDLYTKNTLSILADCLKNF